MYNCKKTVASEHQSVLEALYEELGTCKHFIWSMLIGGRKVCLLSKVRPKNKSFKGQTMQRKKGNMTKRQRMDDKTLQRNWANWSVQKR